MAKSKQYKFKYRGDSHAIDINTLLVTQFHYAAILTDIQERLFPNTSIKIKIQSFEKGSFGVNQIIEIGVIAGQIAFHDTVDLAILFNVLKAAIDIKKLLGTSEGGELTTKEAPDNKIELSINVVGNNNTLTVDKKAFEIYQNSHVIDKALTGSFMALEKDEEIDGIEINPDTGNTKVLDVPRDDFKYLTEEREGGSFDKEESKREDIKKEVSLYVSKLDLDSAKPKWSFVHSGRKINSVAIKDHSFLEQVHGGMKFGKGDRLKADLKIIKKFDKSLNTHLDDKFEVIKVHEVIPKPEQGEIF